MTDCRKKPVFTGVATALVTPFSGGKPDFEAFGRLIDAQLAAEIGALVVAGTTGEAPTLDDTEKLALVAYCAKRCAGRVPVIAGTGGPDTAHMLSLSAAARDAGADALLIVNPYYSKGTESGVVRSYLQAAELGLPIILYNVPGRTGYNLPCNVIRQLSAHPNIAGIKEASGCIDRVTQLAADPETELHIYAGCDAQTLPVLAMGGMGVISVISNILPAAWVKLCRSFFAGNLRRARGIQLAAEELTRLLFAETNPAPVKYLCAKLGICSGELRLPLDCVSPALEAELAKAFGKTLGELNTLLN